MLPGIYVNRDGAVEVWKVTAYEKVALEAYIKALAKALKMPQGKKVANAFVGKKSSVPEIRLRKIFGKVVRGRFSSILNIVKGERSM